MPDGLTPQMELTPQFRVAPSLTRQRGSLRRPETTAMVTATGFCYSMLRVPFTAVPIRCHRQSKQRRGAATKRGTGVPPVPQSLRAAPWAGRTCASPADCRRRRKGKPRCPRSLVIPQISSFSRKRESTGFEWVSSFPRKRESTEHGSPLPRGRRRACSRWQASRTDTSVCRRRESPASSDRRRWMSSRSGTVSPSLTAQIRNSESPLVFLVNQVYISRVNTR